MKTPQEYSAEYGRSYDLELDDIIAIAIADARVEERERCARVAEEEPELPENMPNELLKIPSTDLARVAVRVTKECIARHIRAIDAEPAKEVG